MTGLPEITLAGVLVADPELCVTPAGAVVTNFTVVTNDRSVDPATGKWVDKAPTLLPCSIRRQAAENVAESLMQGARVLVTGVLRQREWGTTGGVKRYVYEVDATEVGVSLRAATVKITKTTRDATSSTTPWDDDEPPP
ncbi:MAG: single-stranded DNA-binding protein [Pseudonocardiales bacterium]|nr:single-stranded DNA-binding protein [Pseudonocardiales bacterium]MBV9729585.1 single-stranded DNA-binding protein [Pseudonocardiales bacterium]